MAKPFISVIVPFYNMEAFLAEAVESVLGQSYDCWELLLVDDGSTDESVEMAKSYAEKFSPRVQYFTHELHQHRGVTVSRNLALFKARGNYVALLDADDYWLPGKLAFQSSIAQTFPHCALIGGASLYWYSWKDPGMDDIEIQVGCKTDELIPPRLLNTILYPLGKGAAPCPSSLLILKEALISHGGFEEQFSGIYQVYEDQVYLFKLYLHYCCYLSSRCMDKYRQRSSSLDSELHAQGRYRKVRLFFLQWLNHYLKGQKLDDPNIKKGLDHAMFECRYPILNRALQWTHKILR